MRRLHYKCDALGLAVRPSIPKADLNVRLVVFWANIQGTTNSQNLEVFQKRKNPKVRTCQLSKSQNLHSVLYSSNQLLLRKQQLLNIIYLCSHIHMLHMQREPIRTNTYKCDIYDKFIYMSHAWDVIMSQIEPPYLLIQVLIQVLTPSINHGVLRTWPQHLRLGTTLGLYSLNQKPLVNGWANYGDGL